MKKDIDFENAGFGVTRESGKPISSNSKLRLGIFFNGSICRRGPFLLNGWERHKPSKKGVRTLFQLRAKAETGRNMETLSNLAECRMGGMATS